MTMQIKIDDLNSPEIAALLAEHLESAAAVTPVESRHALSLEELRAPTITVWSLWKDGDLAGCCALKELDATHGEIKSMRTAKAHLRSGVASALLKNLIAEAIQRGYRTLSLETGAIGYFAPARKLYENFGFKRCSPFGSYGEDPNSVFMTRKLGAHDP
jgi:putative acetyltransferase